MTITPAALNEMADLFAATLGDGPVNDGPVTIVRSSTLAHNLNRAIHLMRQAANALTVWPEPGASVELHHPKFLPTVPTGVVVSVDREYGTVTFAEDFGGGYGTYPVGAFVEIDPGTLSDVTVKDRAEAYARLLPLQESDEPAPDVTDGKAAPDPDAPDYTGDENDSGFGPL